jgi:ABC-type tungstate transport system substrate-binding protein
MDGAALLIAIVIIAILLAALRREHRKVKELRHSLRKATKWLN